MNQPDGDGPIRASGRRGRLNDAMREREDYDEDLQALHKLMERATKDSQSARILHRQLRRV